MFIRRTLSFVGALGCALLLWSAFSANPVCALVLLLITAMAFADPVAGLMLVLALSPVATVSVATFWETPGNWAEVVVLAAALGWLLRHAVRGDGFQPVVGGRAVIILGLVGIASLSVQLFALATQISGAGLAADLLESLQATTTRSRPRRSCGPSRLLEGLVVFTVAATPRAPCASRRVLRISRGRCGAAVLTSPGSPAAPALINAARAPCSSHARCASAAIRRRQAAGSYFLLALVRRGRAPRRADCACGPLGQRSPSWSAALWISGPARARRALVTVMR